MWYITKIVDDCCVNIADVAFYIVITNLCPSVTSCVHRFAMSFKATLVVFTISFPSAAN